MQEMKVQSLVKELRSHMLYGMAKNKNKSKKKEKENLTVNHHVRLVLG